MLKNLYSIYVFVCCSSLIAMDRIDDRKTIGQLKEEFTSNMTVLALVNLYVGNLENLRTFSERLKSNRGELSDKFSFLLQESLPPTDEVELGRIKELLEKVNLATKPPDKAGVR